MLVTHSVCINEVYAVPMDLKVVLHCSQELEIYRLLRRVRVVFSDTRARVAQTANDKSNNTHGRSQFENLYTMYTYPSHIRGRARAHTHTCTVCTHTGYTFAASK